MIAVQYDDGSHNEIEYSQKKRLDLYLHLLPQFELKIYITLKPQ